jgi:hypothetical protein
MGWLRRAAAVSMFTILAVLLPACGGSGGTASPAGGNISACAVAFEAQIVYGESHPGYNPANPVACAGLSAGQLKEAAVEAVVKEMPTS